MNFDAIFPEYYAQFRGQATSIPVAGTPEYQVGIQLANAAIRKWDRADAQEWNELKTTLQTEVPAGTVIATNTHSYAITNMRKPPKKVQVRNGIGGTIVAEYQVIPSDEADNYSSLDGLAYFTGGANSGYVLHLDGSLSSVNGMYLDFRYIKKPTLVTGASSIPEMSDVNFMIQDMLASRAANARNGFLYKTSKQEASNALLNMKMENNTGTKGNSSNLLDGASAGGWGTSQTNNDIRL